MFIGDASAPGLTVPPTPAHGSPGVSVQPPAKRTSRGLLLFLLALVVVVIASAAGGFALRAHIRGDIDRPSSSR